MPTFALNFYSPVVADQLRTGRKTATIRLGDKSAKYRKGMIVTVLVGARYGQREKVFDAVIDKVEVKQLAELSPREIEHDNPEIRRVDEFTEWLGAAVQPPGLRRGHRHGDPVLADRRDDVLAPPPRRPIPGGIPRVDRLAAPRGGSRCRRARSAGAPHPHSSHSTWNAEGSRARRGTAREALRRRTADTSG